MEENIQEEDIRKKWLRIFKISIPVNLFFYFINTCHNLVNLKTNTFLSCFFNCLSLVLCFLIYHFAYKKRGCKLLVFVLVLDTILYGFLLNACTVLMIAMIDCGLYCGLKESFLILNEPITYLSILDVAVFILDVAVFILSIYRYFLNWKLYGVNRAYKRRMRNEKPTPSGSVQ